MSKLSYPISLDAWKIYIITDQFLEQSRSFQTGLLGWFHQNGRQLPWRETHNPYYILISELMLQQTQVDRVIEYYQKFITQFPTLGVLAKASEEEVLALWSGLGYYNRARNLFKIAQIIATEYNGEFPQTKEQILALPGIGLYTVGAILTFAFNIRAPIVDTNVDRVLSRAFLRPSQQLSKHEKEQILWLLAESLLPEENYWAFNQGIMDFGALICIVDSPLCGFCFFRSACYFYQHRSLTRFLR